MTYFLTEKGEAVPCCTEYGAGSGSVHIQNVVCSGSESHITQCSYTNVTTSLGHLQDVGVKCQQGTHIP